MAIEQVLKHYYPEFEAPADTDRTWISCLCPAHDESNPSCAVSYELDAVRCLSCGFKGSAISIVKRKEVVSTEQAIKFIEGITEASYDQVPRKSKRKSRRRVSGFSRSYGGSS